VISNTQAEITAGKKPMAKTMTTTRMDVSSSPKMGKSVSRIWISSQAPAR
jgi:hypothetical protein